MSLSLASLLQLLLLLVRDIIFVFELVQVGYSRKRVLHIEVATDGGIFQEFRQGGGSARSREDIIITQLCCS